MADRKRMHKVREINTSLSLGALAQFDVVGVAGLTMKHGGFITTTELAWRTAGLTAGEGRGLMLGIADQKLTDAEVEEALEANGPTYPKDSVPAAKADRRVRLLMDVGPKGELVSTTTEVSGYEKLETRISFTEDGAGWRWFAYNMGVALTTGASIVVQATHNVQWGN